LYRDFSKEGERRKETGDREKQKAVRHFFTAKNAKEREGKRTAKKLFANE